MKKMKLFFNIWLLGFGKFLRELLVHVFKEYLSPRFDKFEGVKDVLVGKMYQHRGRYSHMVVNTVMSLVMVLGVTLGPSLVVNDSQTQAMVSSGLGNKIVFASGGEDVASSVLGINTDDEVIQIDTMTQVSDKPRSEVFAYIVQDGDTLGEIGKKFGVNIDSIKWLNGAINEKSLKPGTEIKIPPVDGVVHTVKSGETIYSIAKKYNISAQAILDFPFNEFSNDETFALTVGQVVMVPDGVMPNIPVFSPRIATNQLTPNAGVVSATGSWIWPAAGRITQSFKSWHKAIDIANHSGGPILAADSGTVIAAGWDTSGYGNKVMVNHGNGYITLYAHLSVINVQVGQTVSRGNKLGMMGSTGRSTGTHLHFEIRSSFGNTDPLGVLR